MVLFCTSIGGPKVAPPFTDRDTVTPVGQPLSNTSADTYTLPSGPNATTGSDARSQTPPTALVSPGTGALCQRAPPSCVQA